MREMTYEPMQRSLLLSFAMNGVTAMAVTSSLFPCHAREADKGVSNNHLSIVIIRHGEKASNNHNLSCEGQNRALQLPEILRKRFPKFNHVYAPSLGNGKHTSHARMFQTITPLAIKNELEINSSYSGNDHEGIADDVLSKKGTVLLVWKHSRIDEIAQNLGVKNPPKWRSQDYDSIWIVSFNNGKASLGIEQQGIIPSANCDY